MKSVFVLCLVLSLVVVGISQTRAAPGNCYVGCIGACLNGIFDCAVCIGRCIITVESSSMELKHMDNHYFCKLGCSTSLCTKFLTQKNSDEKKVKGCVNSCSQTCTNTVN